MLLHSNPLYAHVRLPSGKETSVNIRDIAPHPNNSLYTENTVGENVTHFDDANSTPAISNADLPPIDNSTVANDSLNKVVLPNSLDKESCPVADNSQSVVLPDSIDRQPRTYTR